MRVSSVQYLAPKSRAGSASSSRASSVAGRREKEITFEGSAGPRELLEGILRQVNAAKRSMSGQSRDADSKMEGLELTYYQTLRSKENEEVERLESFCDRFVSAVKSIGKPAPSAVRRMVLTCSGRRYVVAQQQQRRRAQGSARSLGQRRGGRRSQRPLP